MVLCFIVNLRVIESYFRGGHTSIFDPALGQGVECSWHFLAASSYFRAQNAQGSRERRAL